MAIVHIVPEGKPDPAAVGLRSIYVEVDDVPVVDGTAIYYEQETRNAAADRVLTIAQDVFADGVELARSCAARVADGLGRLPAGVRSPDEFELQLAIKLDSEVGAVLAKAKAGAQMQITLRWKLGTA